MVASSPATTPLMRFPVPNIGRAHVPPIRVIRPSLYAFCPSFYPRSVNCSASSQVACRWLSSTPKQSTQSPPQRDLKSAGSGETGSDENGSGETGHKTSETAESAPETPGNSEKPSRQASILNLDSIFVLSVPITTKRSFIYCHHKPGLLSSSQLAAMHWKVRAENKIVSHAGKLWNKLCTSENAINKRVVSLVRKLLSSIPYDEHCLRSFPLKSAMIREINEEHQEELPRAVLTSDVEHHRISLSQLKPIPVYHPRFQQPQAILDQMHQFRDDLTVHHRKWAIANAIGIPLTLPVALIPVAPNVPGFYMAYRLYCHLQALRGATNLGYLLEVAGDESVKETTHLLFESVPALDMPYLSEGTFAKVWPEEIEENERILISEEIVEELVEKTGLGEIRDDLHRALVQETKRIQRSLSAEP